MHHYDSDDTVGSRSRNDMGTRNDLMTSFTDAIREHPVSAALIGMGALWLFMGGGNISILGGRDKSSLVGAVAHGAGNVAQGATHMARGTAHAVSSAGSAVASGVSSTVSGLADSVSDVAGRVGDYVDTTLHGVDAEGDYRKPEFSTDERGGNRSFGLRSGMQDVFERYPLALGVAGLALGAGVAASLPLTSTERDTLGKANAAVRSKLGEATEQVKDMATAVVDEVQHGSPAGHGPG